MNICEVTNSRTRKEFLKVPKILYTRREAWVCPLDKEIEGIFNPGSNVLFDGGDAIRWILKSENGTLIGRIAAFYNRKKAAANRQPTGGLGFFEIIEDQQAAFMLFDAGVDWLKTKGMEAADAPINFGENNSNWGLLVEGFTHQAYGMPYHKPYYKAFFEAYGFKNYYEQYSYHKDVTSVTEFPSRFMRIADWVGRKPGYTFEHVRFNNIDKYVQDLVTVYNVAWSAFKGDFTPMDPGKVMTAFADAKFILDEELIWFVYFDGKPVSFYLLYPDLNQILKHMNGKLTLWNKLRMMYHKKIKTMTRVRAVIAGTDPRFQNTGLESVIFKHLYEVFKKKPYYKELELSWVGDFNPRMQSIYEALGAHKAKTHITYRYLFNRDAEFIRYKDETQAMQHEKEQNK